MKKEQQDVFRCSAKKFKACLSRQSERNDIWSYILRYSNDKDERKSNKGLTSTEMLSTTFVCIIE
jgi:hypothetical protein